MDVDDREGSPKRGPDQIAGLFNTFEASSNDFTARMSPLAKPERRPLLQVK
jgi:hypothetical protein